MRPLHLLTLLLLLPSIATCTLISSISPSHDASIYSDTTLNEIGNGSGDYLFAGRINNGSGDLRRALLQFNLSAAGVPANAVIESVSLALHVSKQARTDPGSSLFTLHRLSAPWQSGASNPSGQEGAGTTAAENDVTWNFARYSSTPAGQIPWSLPGGDFPGTVSASALVNDPDTDVIFSGSGMVADLQAWVDNPSQNFGWILRGDENTVASARRFLSSADDDLGPRLHVEFSVIPEPGTFGLLLVGGAFLWRQNRRR